MTGSVFVERKTVVYRQKRGQVPLKKNQLLIISVAVCLICALTVSGYSFVRLSGINFVSPNSPENSDFYEDFDEDFGEDEHFESMLGVSGAKSLKDFLKQWSTNNGQQLKSKKVINVLLLGLDNRDSDAISGNSDAIILASLNKETKKITLVSLFRDSYTYMDTPKGIKYAKINAAYPYGGPECLIDTIEKDFKIKIDYYFAAAFKSFERAIDMVGGINVTVLEHEARYIRNKAEYDCKDMPFGENVLLNGKQALLFARIRGSDVDGDISRTRRQRDVITALVKKCESISTSQIGELSKELAGNVVTNCPATDLIRLATQGLVKKWYSYEIVQMAVPEEKDRMAYTGDAWIWVVDYPAAAQKLQLALYGKTNIELSEKRMTAMEVVKKYKG
jgi:LCP family protein required for cell wall assembly